MGMFTSIRVPEAEYELQFKTGYDSCAYYKVGDTVVHGEPDGVYEAIGQEAGNWFEMWSVVIQEGCIVSCTRYPDGTPSTEWRDYIQLPRP